MYYKSNKVRGGIEYMWLRYFSVVGSVYGVSFLGVPIVLIIGLVTTMGLVELKNGVNFMLVMMIIRSLYGLKSGIDSYQLVSEPNKGQLPKLYSAVRNRFDELIDLGGYRGLLWKLCIMLGPFIVGAVISLILVALEGMFLLFLLGDLDIPQIIIVISVAFASIGLSVVFSLMNWRIYKGAFKAV